MRNAFLLNQIIAGRIIVDIDKRYYVLPPSPAQKLRSEELFQDFLYRAQLMGVITDEEMKQYLVQQGIWNILYDTELKEAGARLDNIKVSMYNNYERFRSRTVDSLRKQLKKLKNRINELYNIRVSYTDFTCEGIAEKCAVEYLIGCNIIDCDGNRINIFDGSFKYFDVFVRTYMQNKPTDQQIRTLAKSPQWRSIWGSSKGEAGIFGVPATQLSDEQRGLIAWSKLYDSVYDSMECPDDKVIEDDDLLDGWLIVQHRKQRENRKKDVDGDAQEVFVFAETPEDVQRVSQLNDAAANMIKSQRMSVLKKVGAIKEENMPDSQQTISMKAVQQFRERMKGM